MNALKKVLKRFFGGAVLLLALSGTAHAQAFFCKSTNTWINPPAVCPSGVITTVGSLGNYAQKGASVQVTDGASSTDCSTGGGTTVVTCVYNGSTWSAGTGGGVPSGATNTLQTNGGSGSFGAATNWTFSGSLLAGSQAGTFTNATGNTYFEGILTGGGTCNKDTILNNGLTPTAYVTDSVVGCVNGPASGTGNAFSDAIAGYAQANDSGSTGLDGYAGVVGVHGKSYCAVSNARCWGADFGATDKAGDTGNWLWGIELDPYVANAGTTVFGVQLAMFGTAQPTGTAIGFDIAPSNGTGTWTKGFAIENGAIYSASGAKIGVSLGTDTAAANPANSQAVSFNARTTGGTTVTSNIQLVENAVGDTTDGQFGFGQSPIQVTSVVAVGTQSLSGCSLTNALGGPWAGSFKSGTAGACTVTITMKTATNGFACHAEDLTTTSDVIHQTAYTTTTATISGTTASADLITYECFAF